MTPHELGPYWVQINYHSADAPHTMTLPVKGWNAGTGAGTFDIWAGGVIAVTTMLGNWVDLLCPLFNSDTQFDNFVVYRQLLPADLPNVVASSTFVAKIGTNTDASWAQAVEKIFTARTAAFNLCKISLLDCVSGDNFAPRTTFTADESALMAAWVNDNNAYCGRDNAQPQTTLKVTTNLNQALRKAYRLT